MDRDGKLLRLGLSADQKYRVRIGLNDIPPEAIKTVLRYEDRWFFRHPGVNPLALARSALQIFRGARLMGGSTLTMQVARLAFGLRTGSLLDKFRQIVLALKLERHFTKEEILEAYFNLAPYGGNVEGLGAAALVYFHKFPIRLTASESLALMLVPQNPQSRRPGSKNFLEATGRLRSIWFGEEEQAPLRIYSVQELPFACPHLSAQLLLLPPARVSSAGQERRHFARPLPPGVLRCSTDKHHQSILEQQLASFSARNRVLGLKNAAAMLVHWPSMEVRGLAGSADFFDRSISGQIDGTSARRSPGSTLKPFIYALALDQGLIHPMTLLADMPRSFSGYDPENFDSAFRGPISAGEALRLSRNVPALSLAARLKNPGLYDFLRLAGVHFDKTEAHYGLSLVLGGAEVTMRELAQLYAMLANRGIWQPLRITPTETQPERQEDKKQLLSPEACFITLSMLTPLSSQEQIADRNGTALPVRAKTGTSNGFRDAWTAGIYGPYVLIVWVGNFDNTANPLLVGGRTALPLFTGILRELAAGETLKDTLALPDKSLTVERISVCSDTGDLDTTLCRTKTETWFIPGVSPVRESGIHRTILLDTDTGLRACEPREGHTLEVPWEFWPSELAQQFLRAGIVKPGPPPFEAGCPGAAFHSRGSGSAPIIAQPKPGLIYHISPSRPDGQTLPLLAHADAGVKQLYWFAGERFVGVSKPGETLLFKLSPGNYRLKVVDDAGRSAERMLRIRLSK